LNILNIQPSTVRETEQFTSSQDPKFNVRKIPFHDFLDRLEKELKILQRGLADLVAQPFLVKEGNSEALRLSDVASLLTES
jgi:hypothetical protein